MSKQNDNFFERKSDWAVIKDDLLDCYLAPYVAKILHTHRLLVYVDCFAGKGKFDDGSLGSPLIACKAISEQVRQTSVVDPEVKAYFIDKNHAADLRSNLTAYSYAEIIDSSFEHRGQWLGKVPSGCNLFLYVDPFGIKYLDVGFFTALPDRFSSVEILLNFNSFGFFRDACRVYGVEVADVEGIDEIEETGLFPNESHQSASDALSTMAGGAYWIEIVQAYKKGLIDGYAAEQRIAQGFCTCLSKRYRYTLNLPIRLKKGNRPKYRMVHATNHEDGCILMYENMHKRWEVVRDDIQGNGQLGLFEETAENDYICKEELDERLKLHALSYKNNTPINVVLAEFVIFAGVSYSMKDIKDSLRRLEDKGRVIITRIPAQTANSGKPSRSMTPGKDRTILVRCADNAV